MTKRITKKLIQKKIYNNFILWSLTGNKWYIYVKATYTLAIYIQVYNNNKKIKITYTGTFFCEEEFIVKSSSHIFYKFQLLKMTSFWFFYENIPPQTEDWQNVVSTKYIHNKRKGAEKKKISPWLKLYTSFIIWQPMIVIHWTQRKKQFINSSIFVE